MVLAVTGNVREGRREPPAKIVISFQFNRNKPKTKWILHFVQNDRNQGVPNRKSMFDVNLELPRLPHSSPAERVTQKIL